MKSCISREDQRSANGWVWRKGVVYNYENNGDKIEIESERKDKTLMSKEDFNAFFVCISIIG